MSDLISREALIEALEKEEKIYKDNQTYPSFYTAKAVTRHQPTIEAVPVVHGEWIDKGWDGDFSWKIDGRGNCWKLEECSVCGYKLCGSPKTNFCPFCGARMKGE